MANYVPITDDDYQRLLSAINYVLNKYGDEDPILRGFLEEILDEVTYHVENEKHGATIASEISVVMEYIDGFRDDCEGS